MTPSTLKDAELRLAFARSYKQEIFIAYLKDPLEWRERLDKAEAAVSYAQNLLEQLRQNLSAR